MEDTKKLKENLHQMIDQINDQATLEAIQTLLAPQLSSFYSVEGEFLNQDQVEDMLDESETDIEAGRTTPQQEVDEVLKSWRHQKTEK
jgi:predicted transcriptional regulator